MKIKSRVLAGIALLSLVALFGACSTTTNTRQIPQIAIPLADAEYTILGETSGEATVTGGVVQGIASSEAIAGIAGWEGGAAISGRQNVLAGLFGGSKPDPTAIAKSAALYRALQNMPEADAVVSPRYEIVSKTSLFSATVTVKVTATGVSYGQGVQTPK